MTASTHPGYEFGGERYRIFREDKTLGAWFYGVHYPHLAGESSRHIVWNRANLRGYPTAAEALESCRAHAAERAHLGNCGGGVGVAFKRGGLVHLTYLSSWLTACGREMPGEPRALMIGGWDALVAAGRAEAICRVCLRGPWATRWRLREAIASG